MYIYTDIHTYLFNKNTRATLRIFKAKFRYKLYIPAGLLACMLYPYPISLVDIAFGEHNTTKLSQKVTGNTVLVSYVYKATRPTLLIADIYNIII